MTEFQPLQPNGSPAVLALVVSTLWELVLLCLHYKISCVAAATVQGAESFDSTVTIGREKSKAWWLDEECGLQLGKLWVSGRFWQHRNHKTVLLAFVFLVGFMLLSFRHWQRGITDRSGAVGMVLTIGCGHRLCWHRCEAWSGFWKDFAWKKAVVVLTFSMLLVKLWERWHWKYGVHSS